MDCNQIRWLNDDQYFVWLDRRVESLHIPLSGSIDLTHRCNLKCVHCYIGDQGAAWKDISKELSTKQWIRIIDEFTEAGCLYLLISGGEPLIRKDFPKIYSHAKIGGLLVTVFTNGTGITEGIIDLFKDLPPHCVEISLYGAVPATHEKVTGIKGSFKQCIHGIEKLLEHKIKLSLKTILMTHNRHDFYAMKDMAKAYGVEFHFDAAIFPCFNGDKKPVELRVTPEEAIEKEFSDEETFNQWKNYLDKIKDVPPSDYLYQCGAGLTTFHIDPFGNLQPCQMVTDLKYNLLKGSFLNGWHRVIPYIRGKKAGMNYPCNRCDKMVLCGLCPAFFKLETGSEKIYSDYLCAMGHQRYKKLKVSA